MDNEELMEALKVRVERLKDPLISPEEEECLNYELAIITDLLQGGED